MSLGNLIQSNVQFFSFIIVIFDIIDFGQCPWLVKVTMI
jgi:hypothetical protein